MAKILIVGKIMGESAKGKVAAESAWPNKELIDCLKQAGHEVVYRGVEFVGPQAMGAIEDAKQADAVVFTNLAYLRVNDSQLEPEIYASEMAAAGKPMIAYDSTNSVVLKTELSDAGVTYIDDVQHNPDAVVAAINDKLSKQTGSRSASR